VEIKIFTTARKFLALSRPDLLLHHQPMRECVRNDAPPSNYSLLAIISKLLSIKGHSLYEFVLPV
jgi:hypothetical protein